jgi:mannosyl-3-phosphoglycerate phosphatase
MPTRKAIWWRQRFTQSAAGIAQRIVVVSDDRTLSEPGAYSLPDVQAAVNFLAARGIPLVINSSRTRAEIERLHQTLQVRTPFISEYGGALFLPHGSFPFLPGRARPAVGCDVIEFGRRYPEVVDVLRLTCREMKLDIVGFAGLSIDEAARELGVALVEAQLAKLREYSELFRLVDGKDAMRSRFFRALRRRGLRCWPAGGHHLVTATADRAESLRTLRAIWKQAWGDPILIGLVESDDDVVWLRYVDIAVIVQNEHAGVPARALSKLPTAHVTRASGPRGWSEAIFEYVGGLLSSRGQNQPGSRMTDRSDAPSDARPP